MLQSQVMEPMVSMSYYNTGEPEYSKYARDQDYVQQETLREYLQNNHSKLTLSDRITIFKTLCLSLSDIHDRGLIYRNLHSGKVLVQAGKCYITDLGSCGPVDGKNEKDGMIPYIAPEVLRKRSKNTKESDVYGIGMLMWEIFSGSPPFDNIAHDHCLILEICKEDLRPPILPNMPEEYAEMMQECWDVDPSKRPTIGELYEFARDFSANVYDVNNNNSFVDHNTFHNTVDNSINNTNKTHQNQTSISNNNLANHNLILNNLFTQNSFDNNNNNLDTAIDDNEVEVKNNKKADQRAPFYDVFVIPIERDVSHHQPRGRKINNNAYAKNPCLPCKITKRKCTLSGKDCSNSGNESYVFNQSPRKDRQVKDLNRQIVRLQKILRGTQIDCDRIKENLNHIQEDNSWIYWNELRHLRRQLRQLRRQLRRRQLRQLRSLKQQQRQWNVSRIQNLQNEKITWKDKIMSLFWIYYEINYLLKISQQTEQNK